MNIVRSTRIGPALPRPSTLNWNALNNQRVGANEAGEKRSGKAGQAWKKISALIAPISFATAALLAGAVAVSAQGPPAPTENTSSDSVIPLVYTVENTGVNDPAPTYPTFAKLPIVRPLPDPFTFVDGHRNTDFSSWEQRRNEIFHAVEDYMLGQKPDCHDCTVTANYVPDPSNSLQGILTVNVTRNGQTMTETAAITLPSSGPGPFPYVIGIGRGTGSLPASLFANVATVAFNQNQVTTYGNPQPTDGFYRLYPDLCAGSTCTVATDYGQGGSNSGQYAAWAWGISRLIDGIEIASHQDSNPLPLDTTHSAVTGCSYAGKEALYDGALDERIALTIAQENGGGGAPSWRVNQEIESQAPPGSAPGAAGSVEDINDTNYDWFSGQMFQFAGNNVYKLPFDQHELMAMVAPRALLETGNTDFYWLGNGANYVSARATQQVYNQFGIGDRFGFIIDGNHNHCAVPAEQMPEIEAFIDKFLLGQNVSTDVEVYPNPYVQEETQPPFTLPMGDFSGNYAKNGVAFPTDYPYLFTTMDYSRWTKWWGTAHPVFPNDWNTGGTVVLGKTPSPPMQINAGDQIEGGYALSMPGPHHATTVTVANANIQTDVLCPDGSSYTLTIPLPVDQNYSFASGSGSPSDVNSTANRTVYQGSTTNPGCDGGGSGTAIDSYLTVVGVQDGFAGDGAGPGLITTDTTDPLDLTYHQEDSTNGTGGQWKPEVTVNPYPLNYPAPPLPDQF